MSPLVSRLCAASRARHRARRGTRMTRRPIAYATLTVLLLSVALLADNARDPALQPGQRIERQLARGQQHGYRLALTTGEYARVIVEQRGIDVSVEVRGSDGGAIADFDDEARNSGEEQIDVVG